MAGTALTGVSGVAVAQAGSGVAPGTISTIAGGVGGPAKATTVSLNACGLSFHDGSLYIADASAVREVAPRDGLTTPAGTGVGAGPSGDGGPATSANFNTCGIEVDNSGNLVIAEQRQFRIGVVAAHTGTFYGRAMTAGDIYSVAGTGKRGLSGSGLVATRAALTGPQDVAVDGHGNLVIADAGFRKYLARIRVVAKSAGTFYGQAMKAGHIYTVAGHLQQSRSSGTGHPAIKADLGGAIGAIRVDRAGNLVFADAGKQRIRVVAAKTGTFYGQAMKAGDIYNVAGDGTFGFSGDRGPATRAGLAHPDGVALDSAGNLVIADTYNYRVRVVAAKTGTFYGQAMKARDIYTIAGDGTAGFSGDGGPATSAELDNPQDVAVDSATGNLVIADTYNNRVRLVPASPGTFYGQPMTAGDIYTMAGNGQSMFSGDGGPATGAELSAPGGLALAGPGNMVIADLGNSTVRVAAAATGTLYGQSMTAGDIYTIAGNGTFGFSGDGGPGTSAKLCDPWGVAVDHAGNAVIADSCNNRVRVVADSSGTFYGQPMTAGDIYTVAGDGTFGFSGDGGSATSAELSDPEDAVVDAAGNLVIADDSNERVRVVAASTGTFYGQPMTAGDIYTVAGDGTFGFSGDGGPATSAELSGPDGVAFDGAGNLVIADGDNNRVRVVAASTGTSYGQPMTAGDIYTVAGDGKSGSSGDGGPATSAELSVPSGVVVDSAGNLVIADLLANRVRVVAATAGTFYGVTMTAGDIYTVAGDGKGGFSGDGGPATSADVWSPVGVAVNSAGNLLIADASRRVRMVTG
jgi:secreted PhoX family phosphatase